MASDVWQQAFADMPQLGDRIALFQEHWQLVKTWNKRINLTAILDDAEAAWLHYRDCAEILRVLPQGPIVDMGSGAGFPGMVLAMAQEAQPLTLVEPRRKRASFLRTAKAKLGLSHVRVVEGRSTDAPDARYGAVVTRATFSSLADIHDCLRWAPNGVVITMHHGHASSAKAEESPGFVTAVHDYALRGAPCHLRIAGQKIL